MDETAEQFRRRAQHCRDLTEGATDGPRDDLLRVAADLEQEADEMDSEESAGTKTDGAPPGSASLGGSSDS